MSYTSGDESNFANSPDLFTTKNFIRVAVVGAIAAIAKIYWPEAQKDQAFVEALVAEVETVKKQLPTKVDEVTTLTDISVKDLQVTYRYSISETLNANMVANYRSLAKNDLSAQICANANMRQLMVKGGSTTFWYEDANGTKFDVVINSCTAR